MEKNGSYAAGNTEDNHTRKRTRSEGKSASGGAENPEYTKEQTDAVEK